MAIMRYLRIGDNRYEIADEKIKVSEISPGITYYPIIGNGATDTSASRQWDSTGLQYEGFGGEEEGEVGNATLSLGNDISVGEANSKRGNLVLYGQESSYSVLQSGATGEGTGYYILLPDKQGTVALTTDIPSRTSQLTNDSGFLTSYTETDPTVPAWAKERTKPTYTAAEIGAISSVTVSRALVEGTKSATITVDGTQYDIYSRSGTITEIETAAGAHDTISISSGAVSFNVPTTAAHVGIKFGYTTSGNNRAVLQDSSGNLYVTQKDDNTNTTYTLSNALSSHKFTSTLTAGGSGSGTSTATIQFAAGSNITLTDDTTNKKITIAATDTKYSAGTGLSLSGTTFNISTVPIANGGTGKTTAADAINVLLNGLPVWTATPTDSTYFIRQDTGGSASYGKATFSTLWTYINGKVALNYLPLTGGSVTGPTTFGNTVSIDDLNAGQLVVNGSASVANNLTVGGLINNFKINVGTGIDANNVRTTNGMWISAASITNAAITNHGVLLGFANVGTPFQMYIADSTHQYIYKRSWDSTNAVWRDWTKLYAGYADSAGSATTCSYPIGFASHGSGATWGNTTGTSFTTWNDSTGGSIDFRRDNPSTGKLSVKVDGRFYFNEGNTPAAGLKSANSYWGLTGPDGEDNIWIRSTSQGFIPYQSGSAGSGHGSIGTSGWYWSAAYIDNINGAAYHRIYVSTSAPSGGSNGDVWFVYA